VLALAGYLLGALVSKDRQVFLPGPTTHGHYQIELDCNACHTPMMGVKVDACEQCHGAELTEADDSHPAAKFRDPRNAELLTRIQVTHCVTCHVEHRPELTRSMGVTLPEDYCVRCHEDIAQERPNHAAYGFETCLNGACHNFHDNRALSEDFLAEHLHEPAMLAEPVGGGVAKGAPTSSGWTAAEHDADAAEIDGAALERAVSEWSASRHAAAGVNCRGCHEAEQRWVARPTHTACQSCHGAEVEGYLRGRHGMRLQAGLSPMQPGLARLPMRDDAASLSLGCGSCHGAHEERPHVSAVSACMTCHDDAHSRAYEGSKHAASWRREVAGEGAQGTGVSCATCHLPAVRTSPAAAASHTQHNQNDNLRPNEKMIRSVCMQCHGLQFALDALADSELVRRNFQGLPSKTIESLRMVAQKRSVTADNTREDEP